jgi:hypothetical protein
LRRRHLYYNEIDGRPSAALTLALQRYQERQGFPSSGATDEQTLRSLGVVSDAGPPAEGESDRLPDEPVLRSDAAIRAAPHGNAPVIVASPGVITHKEAEEFVRRYVAACAAPNNQDELGFYADRVDYFDHGVVDRQYVQNEVTVYDQRWPIRRYRIASPVRVTKTGGRTAVNYRVAFQVSNIALMNSRNAAGRTDETLGIGRRGDGRLEIVSVRESRVRRPHRRKAPSPVLRSVRRVFRGIFH